MTSITAALARQRRGGLVPWWHVLDVDGSVFRSSVVLAVGPGRGGLDWAFVGLQKEWCWAWRIAKYRRRIGIIFIFIGT